MFRRRAKSRPAGAPRSRSATLLSLEALDDRTVPSAGALDPSFGMGGLVTTPNTSRMVASPAQAWAVQVDEKIVAAGESAVYSEGPPDFAVARYNLDGTLDTSFAGKGWVTLDFGSSRDVAVAVALQPDGRIVVAGYSNLTAADPSADDGYDFALARLNIDGSLDTSFDGDGKLTIDFGTDQDLTHAVALQADGKIVVSGNRFNPSLGYGFAVARLNTDGSLDTSFDGDGKQFVDYGSYYDFNSDLALQPDGKIVLGGTTYHQATGYDFAVARLNANGTLDTSFDGDGLRSIHLAGDSDFGAAVAVLSDGKIVVGGTSLTGADDFDFDFAVARLNADGSLDTSFDGDGWQTVDLGAEDEGTQDMAIQPDGKVIVVGYTTEFSRVFAVVRLNVDGSLDDSFAGDGRETIILDGNEHFLQGVAVQPDGKIVVAGVDAYRLTFDLVRLNVDGSRDFTFGEFGMVFTEFRRRPAHGLLTGVGLQPDGKIVAANYDGLIVRFNIDGTFDTTFGTNGFASAPFLVFTTNFVIAVQPDGKIVLSDYGYVARLNVDGSLDTSFGQHGTLALDLGFYTTDVEVAANGKIVVAGQSPMFAPPDFMVFRLNQDGSLDTTFDGDGKQTIAFGESEGTCDTAIGPNGEIVVVGVTSDEHGANPHVAVARLKKDGSLDPSFDGDGKQTFDFATPVLPYFMSVEVQPNGKVVVVGGDVVDFYVARLNKNGSLDTSFDDDGKQVVDFGGIDVPVSLAIQSDGKIVVLGTTDVSGTPDFAVARLDKDGNLDTSFDGDGKQVIDFGASYDVADDMALQQDGKIVVVGAAENSETGTSDFGLARLLGDDMSSPKVSISYVEKKEGKNGHTNLFTFTVMLSVAADQPVTVSYRTVDGTAKAGEDYVAQSGTLTFAPGETSKTVTIEVIGDNTQEADEEFFVDLFSDDSIFWSIIKSRGTGTILNDD